MCAKIPILSFARVPDRTNTLCLDDVFRSMMFSISSVSDHPWLISVIRWNTVGLVHGVHCREEARLPFSMSTGSSSEQTSIGNRSAIGCSHCYHLSQGDRSIHAVPIDTRPFELEEQLVPFDSAVFFSTFGMIDETHSSSFSILGHKLRQLVVLLVCVPIVCAPSEWVRQFWKRMRERHKALSDTLVRSNSSMHTVQHTKP